MATRSGDRAAPGARLRSLWERLEPLPGGRWLFGRILGWIVPYTGTIGPSVEALEPGYARIAMRDRRKVRNHLGSIHAVALSNLGEVTSGLALTLALPPGVRGIVRVLTTEYSKKARGRLVAESRVSLPEIRGKVDHEVEARIRDEADDVVARVRAVWRLEGRSS